MNQIVPFPVTFVATQVEVTIPSFTLNATEGSAMVDIFTAEGRIVDRKYVPIPAEIYVQWGVDDNFVVDYVLGELGITTPGL